MDPSIRATRQPGTLDEPNRLYGYAARFNEESEIIFDSKVCKGPFVEVIRPGAFRRTLATNGDILALYNHDFSHVLGRTRASTLDLAEDHDGLRFDLRMPDTTVARDLRESLRRGDIDGCSFQGFVVEDTVEERPGLPSLRTIYDIELIEITPATSRPAYKTTEVSLRSLRPDNGPESPPVDSVSLALARLRLSASGDD